jgi:hypothetical protein
MSHARKLHPVEFENSTEVNVRFGYLMAAAGAGSPLRGI